MPRARLREGAELHKKDATSAAKPLVATPRHLQEPHASDPGSYPPGRIVAVRSPSVAHVPGRSPRCRFRAAKCAPLANPPPHPLEISASPPPPGASSISASSPTAATSAAAARIQRPPPSPPKSHPRRLLRLAFTTRRYLAPAIYLCPSLPRQCRVLLSWSSAARAELARSARGGTLICALPRR